MEPTQLEDQIKFLVYNQFVLRCVWCYEMPATTEQGE